MRRFRLTVLSASGALVLASFAAVGTPATVAASAVAISPMVHALRTGLTSAPTEADCLALLAIPCYNPPQFQTAYNEGPLFAHGINGAGTTIVIVDAFGSPTIAADLATFDAQFALPAPPSLQIIAPAGAIPAWDPTNANGDVGWAGETTLDVEWAHAMAPGANILLVETPVDETEGAAGFPQIVQAENYVVRHHLGDVISQSFGATEQSFASASTLLSLRSAFTNAASHGVTVLAASGDNGAANYLDPAATTLSTTATVGWPASDPLVTAVGGTQLSLDAAGNRLSPDVVWNDTYSATVQPAFFGNAGPNPLATGGGLSSIFHRPEYQESVASVVGSARGIPDVSMSAACSGLVLTYESYPNDPANSGWQLVCGTSEATPLFAGIVALADQVAHHSLGLINPALYELAAHHAPGLVDVTSGNNTVGFSQNATNYTVTGYSAGPGYDLASGVGTINAALFVPELARAAGEPGRSGSN